MRPGLPTQKLFKIALYTSVVLLGMLVIAPHIIIFRSFPATSFFRGIFFLALLVCLIWLINISLLYLATRYLKGRFADLKRYIASYAVCISVVYFSRHFINSFVHNANMISAHLYVITILVIVVNTIVLGIQDLILLREKKLTIELENSGLKIKNVEATNQQLRQQIHPHFLFNSLNTLKALIKKEPTRAEDYLVLLSDFLRASISLETPNVIGLREEIKLCLSYLEMQKIRFGDALQFLVEVPEEVLSSTSIPVFSLLPLVENAIKHNVLTEELPLKIEIHYQNDRIIASNNLQPKFVMEPSTGVGLKNLRERYKLLSGDAVIVDQTGNTFSVSLKLLDNAHHNHRG